MHSKEKKEILKTAKMLKESNLLSGTNGNISLRSSDNVFVITSSGSALGFLEDDEIVSIDKDGNLLEETANKPSSEKFLHLEIYDKRNDINAIIHLHCVYLTSFAVCHKALDEAILAENIAYFPNGIQVAQYKTPSSIELAKEVCKLFSEGSNACLMANHGAIFGAKTLKEAFLLSQTAENIAQIYIYSKLLGNHKLLSSAQISEIKTIFSKRRFDILSTK